MNSPASPKQKHILFLTSTNLACNPRCLKEVRLLQARNIHVTVVAFDLHNWTNEKEAELRKELDHVTFHYLESLRYHLGPWLFSSLLERMSRLLLPILSWSTFWSAMAVNKRSWLMLRWAKTTRTRPDLVIAHNPPAFYAAARLAAKMNIPYALDVEDFHPGEGTDKRQHLAITTLMRRIFTAAAYLSYASPLIKRNTEEIVADNNASSFVVNNIYASEDFSYSPGSGQQKMKLVWFSQHIDFGRGLEQMIPCLEELQEQVELTLIGNRREEFYRQYIEGRTFIQVVPPLSQKELLKRIGCFDAGLAIEPSRDANNRIALSNKIWAYFQAGLYIIASDTEAQSAFLTQYPDHGTCMRLERQRISETMQSLIENLQEIRENKRSRFEQSQKTGWEQESGILLNKWNEVLHGS